MQKIAQFVQPFQPSSVGKIFCLLIAFSTLAAVSAFAGEPPMILAMAKNHSQLTTTIPARTVKFENTPASSLKTLKSGDKTEAEFLSTTHLERQTRESRRAFNFKVGYGEIWHGQAELEKIPADRKPESFAYFKAGFRF